MPEKNERYCYHFLHNQSQGKATIHRTSSLVVFIETPDREGYTVPLDERDQRVLVCFDGRIPTGSLSCGAEVARAIFSVLSAPIDNVYKRRDNEYEEPVTYVISPRNLKKVEVSIYRFFVLLRTGRYVFRVYRPDTLQPRYLIVDVKNGHAEFSTTS